MYTAFGSIVTAAVTPFDGSGQLNLEAFRRLLRHLVEHGSDAVVVCGTTGESPTLTDDEKLTLIRTAIDELDGSAPVIAGTGTNDTAHSVELTRAAAQAGADGILAVTPYYNKPPREGLLRHFAAIANAAGDIPVIVYNIPSRVVINLEPDVIAELASIDNVVALKQAQPDLAQLREVLSLSPSLAVYAGDDTSLLPMVPLGAIGGICVASHLVGESMHRVVELLRSGDQAAAHELSSTLDDVYETLAVTTNPIPVKAALNLLGFEAGPPRLPLVAATGVQLDRIRAMLERHELALASV